MADPYDPDPDPIFGDDTDPYDPDPDPIFGDDTDPYDADADAATDPYDADADAATEPYDADADPALGEAAATGADADGPSDRARALDGMEAVLADVELALTRLREGTYGQCEVCRQPIPDGVLSVAPASRSCEAHGGVGSVPVPT